MVRFESGFFSTLFKTEVSIQPLEISKT